MSASTRTVPAQIGFGRLPSAFAALALVIILAAAVAFVALGTKAAPVTDTGAKGAPPPAFIDHGWSGVTIPEAMPVVPTVPFNDHGWSSMTYPTVTDTGAKSAPILSGGGWGPAAAAGINAANDGTVGGGHSGAQRRAQ